jgi:hypothetical protein
MRTMARAVQPGNKGARARRIAFLLTYLRLQTRLLPKQRQAFRAGTSCQSNIPVDLFAKANKTLGVIYLDVLFANGNQRTTWGVSQQRNSTATSCGRV